MTGKGRPLKQENVFSGPPPGAMQAEMLYEYILIIRWGKHKPKMGLIKSDYLLPGSTQSLNPQLNDISGLQVPRGLKAQAHSCRRTC